ncbi:proline--tRNA ligase [Commensalibacter nepenthis]|uniref:Proline--tRNA ligase n=1 Tax=Commensalibacter nepenthis TaxID=3043872 RepID=A0ABT6Q9D0_9PROT|nr:proline--tRNA ligase [Commensalibacter sp. TBRC 10068]MDI2113518.1 proline--tRNA ligase [Commensalibacter sp. TBRC 10068]
MRLSSSFLPTLKEVPAEAQIVSHRLMLRTGMVRQMSSGIYAWLPAGLRVLNKIADIVREEQEAINAQEVLMPTLQSADLWKRSGRYDAYGPEMLRIVDRHKRDLLYGPTNEEMITDIFDQFVTSYKGLPALLYQIQWKFRDEIRPRFGVMRGREFYMKDGYSFDVDYDGAVVTYHKMMLAYLRTFQRIGVKAIPMLADTGPIGGDLSHEFIILAPTGESGIFFDSAFADQNWLEMPVDIEDKNSLAAFFKRMTSFYAATDEKHDEAEWEKVPQERKCEGRGIEVGQIFYFGTKYSESMDVTVAGSDSKPIYPHMGSYGIGVSRLVGAIIESSHDENGIIWPDAVAPFKAVIINLGMKDQACKDVCESLYQTDSENFLYDDRDERAGAKFADADLMGHPWQIIVGPRGVAQNIVEIKRRKTGMRAEVPVDQILEYISAHQD